MAVTPGEGAQSILIVEDQEGLRRMLQILFRSQGFRVTSVSGGSGLAALLTDNCPDIVLSDLRMDPVSGIDVLRMVHELRPDIPVILMTAFGTIAVAVEAMKLGAVDFITKPFKNEDLLLKVRNALDARPVVAPGSVSCHLRVPAREELVASSPMLRSVMGQIEKIADSLLTVLITGETGTGKSMMANEIHRRSARAAHPFIPINAAALPEPLLESELFGHEKGAFTGANVSHPGLFEAAEGGTIFLDEIGTLSANLQAKLLGVLQDRRVRRVGGHRVIEVRARFIAATNIDIEQAVRRGEFREDLYYRINVARICIPPLREHREDISYLVSDILARHSEGRPFRFALSPQALKRLNAYPFPGNIRELRNAIDWAVAVARGSIIQETDLPEIMLREMEGAAAEGMGVGGNLADMEREQIARTIEQVDGNLAKAARQLGIGRTTLWRRLRGYGLKK